MARRRLRLTGVHPGALLALVAMGPACAGDTGGPQATAPTATHGGSSGPDEATSGSDDASSTTRPDAASTTADAASTTADASSTTADATSSGTGGEPGPPAIVLRRLLAATGPLPFPLSSVSPATHYLLVDGAPPQPDERLYLYADYSTAGASLSQQFEWLLFALDRDGCALDMTLDLDPAALLTVTILDATGGRPVEVETAPAGGGGLGPMDHGVNVWDITGLHLIDPDCGDDALQSVDYAAPGSLNPVVYWRYVGYGAVVRSFRLYAGSMDDGGDG